MFPMGSNNLIQRFTLKDKCLISIYKINKKEDMMVLDVGQAWHYKTEGMTLEWDFHHAYCIMYPRSADEH